MALPPDHIRLLHIESGFNVAPIRCRLVTTSFQVSPPYEALSYTWGSTVQNSVIACDGFPMLVTRNLHDALQYLRDPEQERIMWIDAVCINQNNDLERTEQLGIMKDIYTKASRVVIWLGKETWEDKATFSMLNRFQDLFAKYSSLAVSPFPGPDYGFPYPSDPGWVALVRLFQRPWFQRSWVVQEATMAREAVVVCGSNSVSWELISNVAQSICNYGHIEPYPVDFHIPNVPGVSCVIVVHYLNQEHKSQLKTWGLLSLLRLIRKYLATDPREKVLP